MRVMKFVFVTLFALSFLAWHSPAAEAKGTVHRVLISGGDLKEDITVTDMSLTALLSMAAFEDFMAGEIEPPENPGQAYTLIRQFRHSGGYETFDRVEYYPDEKVVHYLGIENGWSEYDGKWYHVQPEGDMAMQHILGSFHLTPYLLAVTGTGEIYLLDPVTLELKTTLSLFATESKPEWFYVSELGATWDGQKILLSTDTGSVQSSHLLDFSGGSRCPTEVGDFVLSSLDGRQLLTHDGLSVQVRDVATLAAQKSIALPKSQEFQLFASENGVYAMGLFSDGDAYYLARLDTQAFEFARPIPVEDLENLSAYKGVWEIGFNQFYLTNGEHFIIVDLWNNQVSANYRNHTFNPAYQEAGVVLEPISAQDGRLFLYPRLGRYWIYDYEAEENGEFEGGIYVINPHQGWRFGHWQPTLKFSHVIEADGSFYGLEAPRESSSAQVYRMDTASGGILTSVELPAEVTYLAYARLDDVSKVLACSMTESVMR